MDGMSAFGLEAKEATMFADVLAKTASSTNTDIAGLGEAFKYSAAAANAAGLEVQQAAGFLGMLANAGIKGSSGGTVLNAVLRDMKKNAEGGALAIGKTKVAVYDAKGNMRDFSDILGDVEKATKGMTQKQRDAALSAKFGDEAMRGINIAMAEGVGTLKDLEGELYNSAGAAQEMADVMADNLAGDMDSLSSAWEGFKISLFDGGLGNFVRPLVQALTKGIAWITKISNKMGDFSLKNTVVGDKINEIWGKVSDWVKEKLEQLKPTFDTLAQVGEAMVNVLISAFQTLWGFVSPILSMLGFAISVLADVAVWAFQNVIVPAVQFVWGAIEILWSVAQPILALLAAAFEVVSEVAIQLWQNAILPLADAVGGAMVSAFEYAKPVVDAISGAFETFVGWVQSGVEWVQSLVDKVKNFSVPNWLSKLGGGGTIKFEGADGSHATGAYNIPFDGYRAELHRGESVLTANQSDTLRKMGMLERGAGGTTRLNMANTPVSPARTGGGGVSMSMGNIVVQVQGSNASADDIAKAVQRELNKEINKAAAVLGYA